MNMNKSCYKCGKRASFICKSDNVFVCDDNQHLVDHLEQNFDLSHHEIVDVNEDQVKKTKAEEDEETLAQSGVDLSCIDLPINCLARCENFLFVAGKNEIAKFNLLTNLCEWKAQTSTIVWSIDASNDGNLLSAALNSGIISLYSQAKGEELQNLSPFGDSPATKVLFTENSSNLIASSSNGAVTVFDASTKNTRISKKIHDSPIISLAATSNSKTVFSGSILGDIYACSIQKGEISHLTKKHIKSVSALACTQTGILISAGLDGSILTWNAENFSFLKEICSFHCKIFSLAVNQSTSELFISDSNMEMKVVNLNTRAVVRKNKFEQGIMSGLLFNGQSGMIYGIINDMAVLVIDSRNLEYRKTVGNSNLVSAKITDDNQYLVCSFNNGWVKFFNLLTSKIDHDLYYLNGQEIFSQYPELGIIIKE